MSAEKWESVTWDWIEREIVDYLLIANRRPGKLHENSLARLLSKVPSAPSGTPKRDRTHSRSSSNG